MKELIYYTAPWCQPCKKTLPVVQQLADEAGIAVRVVDIEQEPERAQSAMVTSVPTIDCLGTSLSHNRFQGNLTKARLKDWLTEVAA